MKRFLTATVFLALLCTLSPLVHAGWEIEQVHYSMRASGQMIFSQENTVRVSKNRVRADTQPLETIIDLGRGELILLLSSKKLYWRGTFDMYLAEAARAVRKAHFGETEKGADDAKKPDGDGKKEAKGPEDEIRIEIVETEETEELAGYEATKHIIMAKGGTFREIWVGPKLDLGDDLDVKRLHDFQERMSGGLRGQVARVNAAVALDPRYRALYDKGFPLRTRTRLGVAILGRDVVKVSQKEIGEDVFAVPEGYLRTDLAYLLDARDAAGR